MQQNRYEIYDQTNAQDDEPIGTVAYYFTITIEELYSTIEQMSKARIADMSQFENFAKTFHSTTQQILEHDDLDNMSVYSDEMRASAILGDFTPRQKEMAEMQLQTLRVAKEPVNTNFVPIAATIDNSDNLSIASVEIPKQDLVKNLKNKLEMERTRLAEFRNTKEQMVKQKQQEQKLHFEKLQDQVIQQQDEQERLYNVYMMQQEEQRVRLYMEEKLRMKEAAQRLAEQQMALENQKRMMQEEENMRMYMLEKQKQKELHKLDQIRREQQELERKRKLEEEKKRRDALEKRRRQEEERRRMLELARLEEERELEERKRRELEEKKRLQEIQKQKAIQRHEWESLCDKLLQSLQIFKPVWNKKIVFQDNSTPCIVMQCTEIPVQDRILQLLKLWHQQQHGALVPKLGPLPTLNSGSKPASLRTVTLGDQLIDMIYTNKDGIKPLHFSNLTLAVEGVDCINAEELAQYRNVQSVNLDNNKLTSIRELEVLPILESLSVNMNALSDMADIVRLQVLKEFSAESNAITSLLPFSRIKYLREVKLNVNQIISLNGLQHCSNLQSIKLYRNSISLLPELCYLPHLFELDVGRNALTSVKANDLKNNQCLQSLVLYENKIVDFPDISHPQLRFLWLNGNQISSISSVMKLFAPCLEQLIIHENRIQSFSDLSGFYSLRVVNLAFNQIDSIDTLKALKPCRSITTIKLNDNPVASLPGYREVLISLLPNLILLDDKEITDNEREAIELFTFTRSQRHMNSLHWLLSQMIRENIPLEHYLQIGKEPNNLKHIRLNQLIRHATALYPSRSANAWNTITYKYMCAKHAAEKNQLSAAKSKLAYIASDKKHDQQFHAATNEMKNRHSEKRLKMQQKHHLEHLHFVPKQQQTVFIVNEEYQRNQSICVLQRWFKRRLVHLRRVAKMRSDQHLSHAATTVQRVWRGYRIRKKWLPILLRFILVRYKAASKIQAYFKGFFLRSLLKKARQLQDDEKFEPEEIDMNFSSNILNAEFGLGVPKQVQHVTSQLIDEDLLLNKKTRLRDQVMQNPPEPVPNRTKKPKLMKSYHYLQLPEDEEQSSTTQQHQQPIVTPRLPPLVKQPQESPANSTTTITTNSSFNQSQHDRKKNLKREEQIQKLMQEWKCTHELAEIMYQKQNKMEKRKKQKQEQYMYEHDASKRYERFKKQSSGVEPLFRQVGNKQIHAARHAEESLELESVSSSSSSDNSANNTQKSKVAAAPRIHTMETMSSFPAIKQHAKPQVKRKK